MSKPVIFVPGYPGSHIETEEGERLFLKLSAFLPQPDEAILEQLEGPDDLAAEDEIRAGAPIKRLAKILLFDIAKQAKSLYEVLETLKVDPVKFGWDWRRPIWDARAQTGLEQEIRAAHAASGQKVVLIVHSTGGLLARYLLEKKPALVDKIELMIAFGVPWAGVLKSLRFLSGEEKFVTLSRQRAQRLIARSWAAFDLLPPDPANTSMFDVDGNRLDLVLDGANQQTSPLIKHRWFPADLAGAMRDRAQSANSQLGSRTPQLRLGNRSLQVVNVVGWGARTTVQARITGSGASQRITDWKHVVDGPLDGGDGTVPFRSASWLRGADVVRYHVPVGFHSGAKKFPHSSLWRNPGGRNLLRHLIAGESLKPFVYAAVDEDDFADKNKASVRVRISALHSDGRPLEGVKVRAIDLLPGEAMEKEFEAGDGRHRLAVPRGRMRLIHGNRFRRFVLRLSWPGGTVDRVLVVNEQGG